MPANYCANDSLPNWIPAHDYWQAFFGCISKSALRRYAQASINDLLLMAKHRMDNNMLKIYGIPNCDTCRKARKWLDENNIEHVFHDVRQDGLEIQMLERWASQVDWVTLLNTRSTTWRNLPAKDRDDVTKTRAMALMLQHPTLVKRPIFENRAFFAVGFSTRRTDELLKKLG